MDIERVRPFSRLPGLPRFCASLFGFQRPSGFPSSDLSHSHESPPISLPSPHSTPSRTEAECLKLSSPAGIAVGRNGLLYIADTYHHRVLALLPDGHVKVIAGDGMEGFSGDGGRARLAQLNLPKGIATDARGNLYIADSGNHRVRCVKPDGTIITVAGSARHGYFGDDGPANEGGLHHPVALAVSMNGELYIADTLNHRIRKVNAQGSLSTVAGGAVRRDTGDGLLATQAALSHPHGVAFDRHGNLFIADSGHHRVRILRRTGIIETVAGSGDLASGGYSGEGESGNAARLSYPKGLAVDLQGRVWIADSGNRRVRRLEADGRIVTLAGTGRNGVNGEGSAACETALSSPVGVAVASNGTAYIADTWDHCVWVMNAEGKMTAHLGKETNAAV